METVQQMVQEFEQAAWAIAEAKLDEQSWTTLRARVADLIERGDRALGLAGSTGGETWAAIRWERADSPVMLARAFGVVHRRLAAALHLPLPAAEGPGFAAGAGINLPLLLSGKASPGMAPAPNWKEHDDKEVSQTC